MFIGYDTQGAQRDGDTGTYTDGIDFDYQGTEYDNGTKYFYRNSGGNYTVIENATQGSK